MINRRPLAIPIVVTGPAGSGKSKLARAIAERAACPYVNVGAVLHNRLIERGIAPAHRREIGRLYEEHFGPDSYVDVVLGLMDGGVVVDGVRLVAALRMAQDKGLPFFHVMREGRPGWALAPTEPFAGDIAAMRTMRPPPWLVPWVADPADLGEQADLVLNKARTTQWLRGPTGERQPVVVRH
jgi:hypothetical protein